MDLAWTCLNTECQAQALHHITSAAIKQGLSKAVNPASSFCCRQGMLLGPLQGPRQVLRLHTQHLRCAWHLLQPGLGLLLGSPLR